MREPTGPDPLEQIIEILNIAGPWAYGADKDLMSVATEWLDTGFSPQEVHDWLNLARCFYASAAKKLKAVGLDPELAGLDPIKAGRPKNRNDTIGYKVSEGKLSAANAAAITVHIRASQQF
jgi:hypothetical protein